MSTFTLNCEELDRKSWQVTEVTGLSGLDCAAQNAGLHSALPIVPCSFTSDKDICGGGDGSVSLDTGLDQK